jgi:glucokinase
MADYSEDRRTVMTLDAGGTNFVFSATQGNRAVVEPFTQPAHPAVLDDSLRGIVRGFERVASLAPSPPVAISFAFPGPCDYASGIVVAPNNLPAYRNVALGPMLEDRFGLPVFINNDGDLFALGEATAGLLPHVNGLLAQAGSAKRFRNLLGFTLGTGFGCGIVHDGRLVAGDNSMSGEVWLFRNKLSPGTNVEEGVSIRAIKRAYAAGAGLSAEATPEPRVIADIAEGRSDGNAGAAREAFRRLGEVAGDAISLASTLIDGLVVIGGGMAASHRLFLPALVAEMNSNYETPAGVPFRRLVQVAFDLEDPPQLETFLRGRSIEVRVPGSDRDVVFDALHRVGVGVSRLGTSHATAIGAYAHALNQLSKG